MIKEIRERIQSALVLIGFMLTSFALTPIAVLLCGKGFAIQLQSRIEAFFIQLMP